MPSGTYTQLFPPKPKWDVSMIPDLSGKVVLVTGGFGGIGLEIGKQLAAKGARVYLAGRNKAKVASIPGSVKGDVRIIEIDLADLKQTKSAAESFVASEPKLDMLFLNAGVMFCDPKLTTADGYDLQFGTNVLGHYQLTKGVMSALKAAGSVTKDARIVTTSSMGHMFSKGINYSTIKTDDRSKVNDKNAYFDSKLANIMCAMELNSKHASEGIVSMALHPGNIKSDLARHSSGVEKALTGWMLYPIPMGALTSLYVGTSPEAHSLGGTYFIPWARKGDASKLVQDAAERQKLMKYLEENTI